MRRAGVVTSLKDDMYLNSGAQHGNFERGRRYYCNRKDQLIHDLISPSLLRDMSLAKV